MSTLQENDDDDVKEIEEGDPATDNKDKRDNNHRSPPKLEKEVRIELPCLKIEKLKPSPGGGGSDSSGQGEGSITGENSLKKDPQDPSSPPRLDKFIEDDNLSVTSSSNRDEDKTYATRGESKKRINSTTTTHPKRLIQSIFAKPKKEKSKKRKSAKAKKTVKSTQYLRIKITPAAFGGRGRQEVGREEEESENGDGGVDVDRDDGDQDGEDQESSSNSNCQSRSGSGRQLRSRGGGGGCDESEEEYNDDKGEEGCNGLTQKQQIADNNQEDDDRKSEDDDNCDSEHEWKPVRAAMVAAMELVAKKQVTDDMRVERRIRKQIMKPGPPKGRGRRALYKRLNKPVKSYEHTTGTLVTHSVYYDNTFFHKGDIVCLIQDLCGTNHPDLERHRFFQINGFLKIPFSDDCASLTLLKRVVRIPAEPEYSVHPEEEDAGTDPKEDEEIKQDKDDCLYRFNLLDYRPANSSEIMVVMSQLKFVIRCPPEFYYGHDILFYKPTPGRIYTRLGRDIYEYDEEKLSEHNRKMSSTSSEEIDHNNYYEFCSKNVNNGIKEDDESVVSSTNSVHSNISNGGSSSSNLLANATCSTRT